MKKLLLNSVLIALILLTHTVTAKPSRALIESYTPESITRAINNYRIQQGLKPLKLDPLISEQAQNHSRDIEENIVPYGHDGFYNRTRILAKLFPESHSAAENVAYADIDAHDVIKQWINSSGHRKNIEGNYNLTGVGIAKDKNNRIYVTQIFLRDDGIK
jgi:uncharacterized protein YkwD